MPVASPVRRPVTYPASRMGAAIAMGLLPEPTLSWDFARGEAMGALAVTRSGATATFVDAGGVRRTAAANAPRYDCDPRTGAVAGLLREPQRTNIALYSDDVSNANWFKDNASITGTGAVVENGATSAHAITQGLTLGASTAYAVSAEIKASGRRYVQILVDPGDATNYRWATFDLQAGAVTDQGAGVTVTIRPAASGYWLCAVAFTSPGSPSSPYVSFHASNAATGFYPSYVGNSAEAFLIRGIQVEAGHCPTSRIATTSASVQRNADAIALTGTAFSGAWNAAEGALMIEASMAFAPPAGATAFLAAMNDGTTSERINLYVNEANAGLALFIADGGVQQTLVSIASTATYDGVPMRLAAAWRLNSARAAAAAGTLSTLDTTITMPPPTQMELAAQSGAGASGTATPVHIRRAAYWSRRLADEQLRLLSAA